MKWGRVLLGLFRLFLFRNRNNRIHRISVPNKTDRALFRKQWSNSWRDQKRPARTRNFLAKILFRPFCYREQNERNSIPFRNNIRNISQKEHKYRLFRNWNKRNILERTCPKCRKALRSQAPVALWSNCKRCSQANRDFSRRRNMNCCFARSAAITTFVCNIKVLSSANGICLLFPQLTDTVVLCGDKGQKLNSAWVRTQCGIEKTLTILGRQPVTTTLPSIMAIKHWNQRRSWTGIQRWTA